MDITLLDDSFLEPNENFSVILTTTDSSVIIERGEASVTIIDNDSKCQLYF